MSDVRWKHWASYALPGSFFNEDASRELPDRTAGAAIAAAPDGAFAFHIYDTAICEFHFDAELFRVVPIPQNKGPRHYLGGEVYTPDELRALAYDEGNLDKYRTLIANIEGNRWGRAIRTPLGNWQPFEDGDVLLSMEGAAA